MTEPPSEALVVGQRLLARIDTRLPGRIKGFYLSGSAVLGDFRAKSDLDLVAVAETPLEPSELRAVRGLHRRLIFLERRNFDVFYTTFDELSRPPAEAPPGYWACGFRSGVSTGPKHPVAWASLARSGAALRGPPPSTLGVHDDDLALRRWCRANLSGYWRRWLATSSAARHWRSLGALTAHACVWGALGTARIHHTLLTGEIVSKSAAATTAREEWPAQHAKVAEEALRLRQGGGGKSAYPTPFARRRALLSALRFVIDSQGEAEPAGCESWLASAPPHAYYPSDSSGVRGEE